MVTPVDGCFPSQGVSPPKARMCVLSETGVLPGVCNAGVCRKEQLRVSVLPLSLSVFGGSAWLEYV